MKTKRQHSIFQVYLSWSDLDDLVEAQLLWTNDLNEAEIGGLSTPREAARRDRGDSTCREPAMPILFFHGGCSAVTGQIFDLSCESQPSHL